MRDVKDRVASASCSLEDLLLKLKKLSEERPDEFKGVYPIAARQAIEFAESANLEELNPLQGKPSLLHHAVGCGCLEACDALLSRCPQLVFAVDQSGQTPLQQAAQHGLYQTVRLLLLHGADATYRDFEGRTALHLAAACGRLETCQLLLSAIESPDIVNARTQAGLTPLHTAAQSGSARVCRTLLEARADPSLEDSIGWRAQDYADLHGLSSIASPVHETDSAEAEDIYRKWRQRFEPLCRSKMNVAAKDAFLEIGKPRLLGATSKVVRFACRVVDTFGLLKHYSVELASPSQNAASAQRAEHVRLRAKDARCTEIAAADSGKEVELVIRRRQLESSSFSRWDDCQFRVVGDLKEHVAKHVGMDGCQARSPWAMPLKFTSRFT